MILLTSLPWLCHFSELLRKGCDFPCLHMQLVQHENVLQVINVRAMTAALQLGWHFDLK